MMRPIPEYGDHLRDHMTMAKFEEAVECGLFTDYDGFGKLATATEMSDVTISPSELGSVFIHQDFTHVVWFNR